MLEQSIFDDPDFRINTCPFIHDVKSEPDLEIRPFDEIFAMVCKQCGTVGPYGYSPEEAALKWNRREFVIMTEEKYNKYMEDANANNGSGEKESKKEVGESKAKSKESNKKDTKEFKKNEAKK